MDIDGLLRLLNEKKGSDLHLKVGRPPMIRISGVLAPTGDERISPERIRELIYSMMTSDRVKVFESEKEIDFSYSLPGLARFRVNVFMQRGTPAAVIRMVPYSVPTVEELNLPEILKEISLKERGLILVTGATGSGKSTTLAALINHINHHRQCHIITVEDPIEFLYKDVKASICQREIGLDTRTFKEALRRILRQDPDVILIGEMRDVTTIEIALTAAETGHLVFSTLHTNDAAQSIDRIIDVFPAGQQQQVRIQLSSSLVGVVSQRLLKKAEGEGRIAAVEIMLNSPTIQKLIEEGDTTALSKTIEESATFWKMQSLNQALSKLVKDKVVTEEEALVASNNPEDLKLKFRGVSTGAPSPGEEYEFY